MQKLNNKIIIIFRNIYVVDSDIWLGWILDHVFLVMVNAVSDLKSAAVERKEMSRPIGQGISQ